MYGLALHVDISQYNEMVLFGIGISLNLRLDDVSCNFRKSTYPHN